MIQILADAVPGFVPNTGVWTPLLGPVTNASAGLVLWVLGIIGLVGILFFIIARVTHNRALALFGMFGLGLAVIGAIAYGALASGGVTNMALKAGDIIGRIFGGLIP